MLLRVCAVALFGLVAVRSDGQTLWRQYGFDVAHTSNNTSETILSVSNVGRLAFFWASDTFKAQPSAPVFGQSFVFVASDGRVRALDQQTGARHWLRLSCSGEGTQQPALGRGLLLVGDGGGDLAAYDPATGRQVWCDDESGSITSAPAVNDDTVYITNGGDAVAVDQRSGIRRWTFTPADFSPLTQTPAIASGVVYVTGGNSVFALEQASGRKIWRRNLGQQYNLTAASVANGMVYVGGTALYALSAADGHLVWKSELVGVNVTTPAVANGRVFVNSEDPHFGLHAFDASTGGLLWANGGDESEATVTVANGVIYEIAESGELQMFDARNGKLLASVADPDGKPFSNQFGSQPVVANGVVYVATGDYASPNRIDAFRLGP